MRFLLVLAFATVALAGTILPNENLQIASGKIDQRVLQMLSAADIDYVIDGEEVEGEYKVGISESDKRFTNFVFLFSCSAIHYFMASASLHS